MECAWSALQIVTIQNPYQALVRAKASLLQRLNQIEPPWRIAQVCLFSTVLGVSYVTVALSFPPTTSLP